MKARQTLVLGRLHPSAQDSTRPSPCSVLTYSQRLPCPGLKVLFGPTLAKAHPNPRLSPLPVWSEHDSPAPTRGRGSKASPLHGILVLLFALLEKTTSWPRSTGWGRWCQPGSRVRAVLVPGRGAAGRREREETEQDWGSKRVSALPHTHFTLLF